MKTNSINSMKIHISIWWRSFLVHIDVWFSLNYDWACLACTHKERVEMICRRFYSTIHLCVWIVNNAVEVGKSDTLSLLCTLDEIHSTHSAIFPFHSKSYTIQHHRDERRDKDFPPPYVHSKASSQSMTSVKTNWMKTQSPKNLKSRLYSSRQPHPLPPCCWWIII